MVLTQRIVTEGISMSSFLFADGSRALTRGEYVGFWLPFILLAGWMARLLYKTQVMLNKNLKLQGARDVLHEIADDEVRTLRTWVLDEMATGSTLANPTDHSKARRVAVSLDRIGYLVRHQLVDEVDLYEWQSDEIQALWRKLKPVVYDVRTRSRPHYCRYFEYLGDEWLSKMTRIQRESTKHGFKSLV